MRYFVTGATGFIGGHVARQLLEADHDVVALARRPEKAGQLAALGAELVKGDITERDSMREAMRGCDGVFHLAAWYKVGQRDTSPGEAINVGGTRNVLELMKELAIPRGVYTSTMAVFSDGHGEVLDETHRYEGPMLTEYERTKWVAHYRIAEPMMEQGLPLTIVMSGVVYGPGDTSPTGDTLRMYLQGKLPMVPRQTGFSWAHVEDVARGHLLAMDEGKPGETYIITGPPHTLIDTLAIAQRLCGVKAPSLHASPGLLRGAAKLVGVVEKLVPMPEMYASETIRNAAGATYYGDASRAKRELGFDPRPLEEGLRETLAHEMAALGLEVPAGLQD